MNSKKAKLIAGLFFVWFILGIYWRATAVDHVVSPGWLVGAVVAQCDPTRQDKTSNQKALPNAWHGLVPLRANRADVEHLLGKPRISHGFTYIYQTKDERVDVLYSAGSCKLSGVERWNVPEEIVIRIDVAPSQTILVKDLHLDQKKYARFQFTHPDNWVEYWNKEDGIIVHTLWVGKAEEVYIITYEPTAKDKPMRCE